MRSTEGSPSPVPGHPEAGSVTLRPAAPGDEAEIHRLVRELAAYEREPSAVRLEVADLGPVLFGAPPLASALVADVDGHLVAFALWYRTFSTWTGRAGMHLEDLFVEEPWRRRGLGRALFARLAAICREEGFARLEWNVLQWNDPALSFYRALGAVRLSEWETWRLDGDTLGRIGADEAPSGQSRRRAARAT